MTTTTTSASALDAELGGRSVADVIRVSVPEKTFGNSLRATKIVWYREVVRFVNDRTRAVAMLIQPILLIFVLGTGMSSLMARGTGVNLRTFIYPGALAQSVLFTAVFAAGSIVWDREFGFLREMFVAPISRASIVLGKALGGATVATIQGAFVVLIGGLAGLPYNPVLILTILAECALIAFTLTAFGVLLAARVKTFQGFMGVTQTALMPLFFTAGAMFPLGNLPTWLTVITRLNPITYAIDPIRRAIFSHLNVTAAARERFAPGVTWGSYKVPTMLELAIVLAMGLAFLAVAILEFRKAE